jgi:hypothetical protein
MIGLPLEFRVDFCPERSPVGTRTVMDTGSDYVPGRLMMSFAENIGSNVIAI